MKTLVLAACLGFAPCLTAQHDRWIARDARGTNLKANACLERCLVAVGDINADGIEDVVSLSLPARYSYLAMAISGRDGATLWTHAFTGTTGSIRIVADQDADKRADVLLAYRSSTSADWNLRAVSAKSGKEIFTTKIQGDVAKGLEFQSAGNVDLTAGLDFVFLDSNTYVAVYSRSASLVHRNRIDKWIRYGMTVVDDADGDGAQEIVGTEYTGLNLYSATKQTVLATHPWRGANHNSITYLDDHDGDGTRDIGATGWWTATTGERLVVFSGKTMQPIFTLDSSRGVALARTMQSRPDSDGDKKPDLLVQDTNGRIWLYPSRTNKPRLASSEWDSAGVRATRSFTAIGDVDGDLVPDAVYTRGDGDIVGLGSSLVPIESDQGGISLFEGGQQKIRVFGTKQQAGMFVLVLGSLSGTAPGIRIQGRTLPLNADSFFTMALTAPRAAYFNNLATLDSTGRATVGLTIPRGRLAALAGKTLHHSVVLLTTNRQFHAAEHAIALELNLF